MSEQALKLGNILVNKKEFHASKQAIALTLVDTDKIVVSLNTEINLKIADIMVNKYRDNGSKYFIGYLGDDDIIRPLCTILP